MHGFNLLDALPLPWEGPFSVRSLPGLDGCSNSSENSLLNSASTLLLLQSLASVYMEIRPGCLAASAAARQSDGVIKSVALWPLVLVSMRSKYILNRIRPAWLNSLDVIASFLTLTIPWELAP